MSGTTLFAGLIIGSLGTGYFIYGKKQRQALPILCGLLLIVIPYLIDSMALLVGATVVLCVIPFAIRNN